MTATTVGSATGFESSSLSADERTAHRLSRLATAWAPEAAILFLIAVCLPISIAVHYRSLGSPSSDDWAYDLAAYRLAAHGHLYLYHWARANLIGQLVIAVPVIWLFGEHASVLTSIPASWA